MAGFLNNDNKYGRQLLDLSALLAGLALPFAFAPYHISLLLYPLLAWLFVLSVDQTPALAFRRGWLFGFGWFAHGLHWVFYSLHNYGGSPFVLTIIIVLLLASVLALYPALALYLARRFFKTSTRLYLLLVLPLLWLLSEWLRGYFLTGMPWLQTGYSQIDTPLAGYVPLVGGLGVSGLAAFIAALLALSLFDKKYLKHCLIMLLLVVVAGSGLQQLAWTFPVGEKIKVSLIQGNIPQDEKWTWAMHEPTLAMYRALTNKNPQSDLVIWPETAVPDFDHAVVDYLELIRQEAKDQKRDVILGIFIHDQTSNRYYNSVMSMRGGQYQKRHLVPLGEYYPFRSLLLFLRQWINIPLSDVDSGPEEQAMIEVAGHKVGISICFEDAFDRDVLKSIPEATMLVNVSNDGWFDKSPEAAQHHQIARMRALETGRYMLRSTNTGISAIIDAKGKDVAVAPWFERYVLTADAQPHAGQTPYAVWKNYLSVSVSFVTLLLIYFRRKI